MADASTQVQKRPRLTREQAVAFFAELFYGEQHIPGEITPTKNGHYWTLTTWPYNYEIGSYDYDLMTRMVFLAHDSCIRAQILPEKGGRVRIVLDARNRPVDGDDMTDRHPTIEEALAKWREKHPAPVEDNQARAHAASMLGAMRCLRHMLGVGVEVPVGNWGHRNHFSAEPGHHSYSHLLTLKSLGLAIEDRPGHWSATVEGAWMAGLTASQVEALGLADGEAVTHG